MTENLKIEVSMVNVEGGVVDTSLATKQELAAAVETKADLVQGKVPVIQLPGFNEISGVSEAINGVETKLRDEMATTMANNNNGLESRIDEKLVLKADLVNGRVPASQSPAFKDVEGAKGALDGLKEALTTKYDQKVKELSEGKADLVDGKIPTSQLPIDGIVTPLEFQLKSQELDTKFSNLEDSVEAEKNSFITQAGNLIAGKANAVDVYDKVVVDNKLGGKVDKSKYDLEIVNKVDQTYLDDVLTGFTNGVAKFYPTLAEANADISNIAVKDKVEVGEATNGGAWYKASIEATSLTKSAYEPLTQAKSYTDAYPTVKSKAISSGGNIDSYTTEGLYRVPTSAIAAAVINLASTRAGALEVLKVGEPLLTVQRYTEYAGDRKAYMRTKVDSGLWTAWKEILTSESYALNTELLSDLLQEDYYGMKFSDAELSGDTLYTNGNYFGFNNTTAAKRITFNALKARIFNENTDQVEYRIWLGTKLTTGASGHYVDSQAKIAAPDFSGVCKNFPTTDTGFAQSIVLDKSIIIPPNTKFMIVFKSKSLNKFKAARATSLTGNIENRSFNLNSSAVDWASLSSILTGEASAGFYQAGVKYVVEMPSQAMDKKYQPELILPSKIYALRNLEAHIYPEHLLLEDHKLYEHDVICSKGRQRQRGFVWSPSASDAAGDFALVWDIYDKQTASKLASKSTTITLANASAKSGQTVNALVIGDSYIASGHITQRMLDIAVNDVMKVNLIGTRGDGLNKHEGRGGWALQHYVGNSAKDYKFNVSGVVVPPAINSTVYKYGNGYYKVQEVVLSGGNGYIICSLFDGTPATSGSGTLTKHNTGDGDAAISFSSLSLVAGNPFWNDATNKLDFANYLTRFSLVTPNYVFIELGVNDTFAYTTDSEAWTFSNVTAVGQYNTLINAIKADAPNAKIAIMLPPCYADQDGFGTSYACGQTSWRAKRNILLFNKAMIANFSGKEAQNIYILASGLNVDTVANFPRNEAGQATNSHNSTLVYPHNNGVHPDVSGYKQIGDAVFTMMKAT